MSKVRVFHLKMSLQCKVQYLISRLYTLKRHNFLISFDSPYINQSDDIKIFWSSCPNLDILVILSNGTCDVIKKSSNANISRTVHSRHMILYIFGISTSSSNQLTPLRLSLTNFIFLPYKFRPFSTGKPASLIY